MHTQDLSAWQHAHRFDTGNAAGERGTRVVTWLTLAMMVVEIVTGWLFNSMALLADGFHMSSHVVAIGLSAYSYAAARRHAADRRYAFGTWKIEILGGFTSAIILLAVVALMVYSSIERLFTPTVIHYQEAIIVAVVGLAVNIVCALVLGNAHHQGAGHGHDHDGRHDPHHQDEAGQGHDLNLKSAYLHVVADATTSVLAVLALLGGWSLGWTWLDPVIGLVGAVVVAMWARRLISDTSKVLLDREMDHPVVAEIREAVEENGRAGEAEISDLHVWRVGRASFSCALAVVSHDPALDADMVRRWLAQHEEIVHTTIEVHHCPDVSGSAREKELAPTGE